MILHKPAIIKYGPTPHGVGGLKFRQSRTPNSRWRPTPHGVGGLKYGMTRDEAKKIMSHPARGGWIEMSHSLRRAAFHPVPPLTGWNTLHNQYL